MYAADDTKVAVVTGATQGIGLETARELAELGYRVVLTGRNEDDAARLATELPGGVIPFKLDVTSDEDAAKLARFLEKETGRVDVLVNNAGIDHPQDADALEVDLDVVRQTIEVNTLGAVRVSQALVPLMRRNGYGRIVNVSTGMGQLDEMGTGHAAYRISKTALNAVTKMLAGELADAGDIKVNCLNPGWVRTRMGGEHAERPVDKGAETVVWLATLPEDGPTGGFFKDKEPIPW